MGAHRPLSKAPKASLKPAPTREKGADNAAFDNRALTHHYHQPTVLYYSTSITKINYFQMPSSEYIIVLLSPWQEFFLFPLYLILATQQRTNKRIQHRPKPLPRHP
jgi:hypothetical protein